MGDEDVITLSEPRSRNRLRTPGFTPPPDVPTSHVLDERALQTGRSGADVWNGTIDELRRLRTYEDGWDGDGAVAPPPELVDSAIRLARDLNQDRVSPPTCVLPGVNGTVVFEWVTARSRLEIEFVEPYLAEVTDVVDGAVTDHWVLVGRHDSDA
jgi:hypothetical protein